MSLLTFAFELYFAATLGIAGLAKVDNPQYFAKTLRRQKIVPSWSILPVAKVFPWAEIGLGFMLLIGIEANIIAIFTVLLFTGFLGVKLWLLVTRNAEDCGCYGGAASQQLDAANIGASSILVLLAGVHLWLVFIEPPVAQIWRLGGSILFVGMIGIIIRKMIIRHRKGAMQLILNEEEIPVGQTAPSFIAIDQEENPITLDDFQGRRRLLVFISTGCPFCPAALRAVSGVLNQRTDLVGLVIGGPTYERNQAYAAEYELKMPLLTPDHDLVQKIYRIGSFPIVFAIDESGVIRGKRIVNNREHLQELLTSAFGSLNQH